MQDRLITTAEAAHQLGVAEKSVRNWLWAGNWPLRPVRMGRAIRWRQSDIDRVIAGEITVPLARQDSDC